jgi:hypothetical protein
VAAKRGKSQAKRNNGNGGALPGWAWMVLGILLAVVVILVAPKYLKSDGDGFFRPQPNPDAQPAPVASGDDEGVVSDESAGDDKAPARKGNDTAATKKDTDYDFYTLLPGKEVPMSDAELAASERAEARQAQAAKPQPEPEKPAVEKDTAATLPKPVDAAVGASTGPASGFVRSSECADHRDHPGQGKPRRPDRHGCGSRRRQHPLPAAGWRVPGLGPGRGNEGEDRHARPRRARGIGQHRRQDRLPGAHGALRHRQRPGRCQAQAFKRRLGAMAIKVK